jgi:hypothetical protein
VVGLLLVVQAEAHLTCADHHTACLTAWPWRAEVAAVTVEPLPREGLEDTHLALLVRGVRTRPVAEERRLREVLQAVMVVLRVLSERVPVPSVSVVAVEEGITEEEVPLLMAGAAARATPAALTQAPAQG